MSADQEWAALDEAAMDHGLLPAQAHAIATLCAALQAFEQHTDPTLTANPMTLLPSPHGLAVWRVDEVFPGGAVARTLLGLICCPTEDWWPFVPARALPGAVEQAARFTWPTTEATS